MLKENKLKAEISQVQSKTATLWQFLATLS